MLPPERYIPPYTTHIYKRKAALATDPAAKIENAIGERLTLE
jgi:hypothetical protein